MPFAPRHATVLGALALLALLGAEGAIDEGSARAESAGQGTRPSGQCPPTMRTGRFRMTVSIEGQRRTALIRIPRARASRSPMPLMLALHGAGGNGPFMERYTGLTPVAYKAGFAVAYPDAEGKFWQLQPTGEQAHDDIAFMRALLDQLEASECIDPARVYATGVSNGGGLTARLGCEMSDRLAAIAPVAGGYAKLPPCRPDRPVSVLEIHGTEDASVDYSQVAPFLEQWATLDSCSARVARVRLAQRTLATIRRCARGTAVEHVRLIGGPHAWPGTPVRRLPGHDSAFSASDAVIRFFGSRRRSAPRRRER